MNLISYCFIVTENLDRVKEDPHASWHMSFVSFSNATPVHAVMGLMHPGWICEVNKVAESTLGKLITTRLETRKPLPSPGYTVEQQPTALLGFAGFDICKWCVDNLPAGARKISDPLYVDNGIIYRNVGSINLYSHMLITHWNNCVAQL